MKKNILLILSLAVNCICSAQTPTWSKDIAPIIYATCTKCHRTGGIAPFTLQSYNDAYNNRYGIQSNTASGYMPPWSPDSHYTSLANERILTDVQKKAISDWVTSGAPSGDLTKAPPAPTYSGIGEIATPDLVLTIPPYNVNTSTDLYRCFAIPSNLLNDQFVTDIEVIPGNRRVVHHVLAYQDTTQKLLQNNGKDGQPGYTNFGGTGSNQSKLIFGWVPGQGKMSFPKGLGVKLKKNAVVVLQVHYPGGTNNQTDSTRIVFKYAAAGTSSTLRELSTDPILNHYTNINTPLSVPANTKKSFVESQFIPVDVTGLSVAPHMHLVGRNFKVYALLPSGDTMRLINVPNWDFHWQGSYQFKNAIKIPAGTTLRAEATYDNTTNNPANPNSPPKNVTLGENTTDEMMLVYFQYMLYKPGDENIVIDSARFTPTTDIATREKLPLLCYPNPARAAFNLQFNVAATDYFNVDIFNLQGDLVRLIKKNERFDTGAHNIEISASDLPSGTYWVRVASDGAYGLEKLIRVE